MLSQQQVNDLNTYITTTLQPQLLAMGLMYHGIEQRPEANQVSFQFNLPPLGLLVVNTQGDQIARASLTQIGDVIIQTLRTEQQRVRGGGGMPAAGQPVPQPPINTMRPMAPTPAPQQPAPAANPQPTDKQQQAIDTMIRKFEVLLERAAENS